MFVFNIKVNGSKIFKYIFFIITIILISILFIVISKIFNGALHDKNSECCLPNGVSKISPTNYTNILKITHEDITPYLGKKINFTGYVYRVLDLKENQFILARDMLINSKSQSVVVGFLCEYNNAKDYKNDTWIEITGEITKGNYHGNMPIIKITEIKNIDKPSDEYVYPPDDLYIPTSSVI